MTQPEWTNDEWLRALRGDEEAVWAALRTRVLRGLQAYLTGRVGPDFTAEERSGLVEDAVQDTLLTVRAKLETFRNESRFTTWVYRIAVNTLLGEMRRRRWERRAAKVLTTALPELAAEGSKDPERDAIGREFWRLLGRLIERELTPYQRGVLLAHGMHQKPLDLVAIELGVSRDALYKAIHDARRKLRAALLAQGVTLPDALKACEG